MSMAEDRRRYRAAGLLATHHILKRSAGGSAAQVKRMDEDKSLYPVIALGLSEKEKVSVWRFLMRFDAETKAMVELADGEDDCAENISHPCPPSCNPPPNGD